MGVNLCSILYLFVDFLAHGYSQGLVSLADRSCFREVYYELNVNQVPVT